ncbi:hypothetical protein [Thermostichus vulcanus]|nr:hypothetical protein [Thermostichus vulcanus]
MAGISAEGILFSVGGSALLMALNCAPMVCFALRAQSGVVAGSLL